MRNPDGNSGRMLPVLVFDPLFLEQADELAVETDPFFFQLL